MVRSMKGLAVAGAIALGLAAGGALGQADTAQEISDDQLDQFVVAVVEVREIQASATAEAQTAANEEESRAILAEANEQAVSAVEDSGLTVDEYNMILAQVQADPELLAMVQERVAEQLGEPQTE